MLELTQLSICGWPLLQWVMIQQQIGTQFISLVYCTSISQSLVLITSVSASLMESQTPKVDPLLNSYNDYEDSVYGN